MPIMEIKYKPFTGSYCPQEIIIRIKRRAIAGKVYNIESRSKNIPVYLQSFQGRSALVSKHCPFVP